MRKLTLALAALWLAFSVKAQDDAPRMSLEQAIAYALQENINIKNAQIDIADAEQQIIERRAAGLPRLSGSASFQHYLAVPQQPLPDGFNVFGLYGQALFEIQDQFSPATQMALQGLVQDADPNGGGDAQTIAFFLRNNFTAALNLDAMIFDGSYFVALEAAREYRKYTAKDFATQQREVTNQVTEAYLPVVLVQENIEILNDNISNLDRLLFETQELYKAGFVEQLDIDRLQLSLSNLRIERENLVRQQEVALSNLKFAIGYPISEPLVLTDNLESILDQTDSAELATAVADPSRRPEYELIEQAIRLTELNVKLSKSGYLPSLRAFGVAQQQYQGDDFSSGFWAPASYVGLNLNVPIFDGFGKKAKLQRSRLEMEKTRNQQTDLIRAINLEVENARTNYLNARQRLDSQNRNLDLAERIYKTAQIKYEEGVGSSLEINQAEQSLYSTQSNYMQSLYDLALAQARLEMALGL